MKKLILIFAMFIIAACTTLSRKMYSVKNPQFENYNSQKKVLRKHNIDDTSYHFKNVKLYIETLNDKKFNIPNAYFFNSKGEFVSYKKSPTDCSANVFGFIKDFKNFKNLQSSDSLHLKEILSLTNINSSAINNQSEITVILTWAVFAGKVNDEKTFKWIELLKQAQNDGVDVTYYLINCDLQDSWNLTDEQRLKIKKLMKL